MELEEGCGAESCACALRRWGSKVSPKLFVAREYVLKHIRLKHAEKVEAQRERVRALSVTHIQRAWEWCSGGVKTVMSQDASAYASAVLLPLMPMSEKETWWSARALFRMFKPSTYRICRWTTVTMAR